MTNDPAIKLTYDEPAVVQGNAQPQPSTAPTFAELWGTIRVVSAVPSWTPRGRLEDSLALYINGATYRLYVYDHTNSAWRYATLT
jgi:hypothetical protein